MRKYVKKTPRRRYDERQFSVRAAQRHPPDLHKLCEARLRLTLHEVGQSPAHRRAEETPKTYREPARHNSLSEND